jgi:hypothetical protein
MKPDEMQMDERKDRNEDTIMCERQNGLVRCDIEFEFVILIFPEHNSFILMLGMRSDFVMCLCDM